MKFHINHKLLMMKFSSRLRITIYVGVLLALLIPSACVDLEFDQPPAGGVDPNIPVTTTIASLKSRHTLDAYEEITDEVVISGIVISNDAAGNFFKQLVIQDNTGGIEMRIEATDLHNLYPVGRKVYVLAQGLWLGDFNGLIQLGAGVDQIEDELIRIPESLLSNYIVPATYGNTITPKVLTIDQLSLADVSTLVTMDSVQFSAADAGQPYANASLQLTLNREIEDCNQQTTLVRTSGFAEFAGDLTPIGNGSLTGVLGIFGDDFQFTLRDLNDVEMTSARCHSGTGGSNINESFTSIDDDDDVILSGWANIAVKGTRLWRGKIFEGNHYAQATSFGDTQAEMEAWLITPPIELNVPKKLTFESAHAFYVHPGLSVWISSDFNGVNVQSATWTQLSPVIANTAHSEHEFIPSGVVDLSGYTGIVRIGFKYVGSGPGGQTTTFRIDNVKVEPL